MDPRPGAEEKALFLIVFTAKESFPTHRALALPSLFALSLRQRVTAVFLRGTVDSRFVFLRPAAASELSRTINDGTLEIVDDNETAAFQTGFAPSRKYETSTCLICDNCR